MATFQPFKFRLYLYLQHHLHPFYYRHKPRKYYDCAIEEDWKPFESSDKEKYIKSSKPVKKYESSIEKIKFKPFVSNDKKKAMLQSRSDSDAKSDIKQEHAKLVRDINEMLENDPRYRKYRLLPEVEPIRVADEFDDDYLPSTNDFKSFSIPDLPIKPFDKQTFKKHNSAMPFQKYKKFKVTMKPKQLVFIRYAPSKNYQSKQGTPNHRRGRHTHVHPKPKLSMLEQFLLLFPRLK